jgi:hypothetical protein
VTRRRESCLLPSRDTAALATPDHLIAQQYATGSETLSTDPAAPRSQIWRGPRIAEPVVRGGILATCDSTGTNGPHTVAQWMKRPLISRVVTKEGRETTVPAPPLFITRRCKVCRANRDQGWGALAHDLRILTFSHAGYLPSPPSTGDGPNGWRVGPVTPRPRSDCPKKRRCGRTALPSTLHRSAVLAVFHRFRSPSPTTGPPRAYCTLDRSFPSSFEPNKVPCWSKRSRRAIATCASGQHTL